MRLAKYFPVLSLALLLAIPACGDDGGDTPYECADAVGTDHGFVISAVRLPATVAEADDLGLDIDGALPVRDNKLGRTLANLAGTAQLDLNGGVSDAIAQGDVYLLAAVTAEDLSNATCVGVSMYLGANPSVAPCADEEDLVCGNHLAPGTSFEIAADSPRDARVIGRVLGGHFSLGADDPPGNVSLELNLIEGADPLKLDLIGARIDIRSVSEDGLMEGRLGGALTLDDVQGSLLPTVYGVLSEMIAADCAEPTEEACCTAGSPGEFIVTFFDQNDDCEISFDEFRTNGVIATALSPDLDLLDADGNFEPDGVAESLSLGLGFTAVKANIQGL